MDEKIKVAIILMNDFLKLAEYRETNKSKWAKNGRPMDNGAIKRKSMDLTRALAALRKPNY